MDTERSPIESADHDEEVSEEADEVGGHVDVSGDIAIGERGETGGGELFGEPAIPPTRYHCADHGDVLSQDVVWKRDGRPYCPECDAPLDSD